MPKRVFWPVALVIMGIILLATNVGMLPKSFWNLWPLILIIVGLGGLLISDKEEWDTPDKKTSRKSSAKKSTTQTKKKTTRASTKKSSTKKSARAKSRKR